MDNEDRGMLRAIGVGVALYLAGLGGATVIQAYGRLPPGPAPVVVKSEKRECVMDVSGEGISITFTGDWTVKERIVMIQSFRERVNPERQYTGPASVPWQ